MAQTKRAAITCNVYIGKQCKTKTTTISTLSAVLSSMQDYRAPGCLREDRGRSVRGRGRGWETESGDWSSQEDSWSIQAEWEG